LAFWQGSRVKTSNMNIRACIIVSTILLLLSSPSFQDEAQKETIVSQRLRKFEEQLEKGEKKEEQRPDSKDGNCLSGCNPFDIIFDIICSPKPAYVQEPPTPRLQSPVEREPKKKEMSFKAGLGPLIILPSIPGYSLSAGFFYGTFGIEADFLHLFEEVDGIDKLAFLSADLNVSPWREKRIALDFLMGIKGVFGEGNYGAFEFGLRPHALITKNIRFDLLARLGLFENTPLFELGAGVGWIWKWGEIWLGYRSLIAKDETLDGPELRFSYIFKEPE